jgi:hypothetical protein
MIVQRDDLTNRTGLSKSALTSFEMCSQKAWQRKWHPRPFIPNPRMAFGSAVDAGVEKIVEYVRIGQPVNGELALAAAHEAGDRDGIEVDYDEVLHALTSFEREIVPQHDWRLASLQEHIHVTMDGWGEVDGHPDIILPGEVWDVKTGQRRKETARTIELGMYALMVEEAKGRPVERVGYFVWVRTTRPYWQTIATEVTSEFREWTNERVMAYVRADRLDDMVNAKTTPPENWTFPGGPINATLCKSCEYSPQLGGECRMAVLDALPGGGE